MNNSKKDIILSKLFKVLSDPHRIQIIRTLYNSKHEMTCGEVGKQLNLGKSTISYHFKALRHAGLTKTRKQGQLKYLSLNVDTFKKYLPGFLKSL